MIRSILLLLVSATPLFAQSADDEKYRRPFGPYQTPGLLSPRPVDESTVDREAILRELLPPEIVLERQQELVRRTILAMQGLWRVETFMLDGVVLRPEEFAGLKYRIQDTVMVQSETSTQWLRPVAFPSAPSKLQTNLDNARRQNREPGSLDTILRETVEEKPEWLVPAHIARPTGMSIRNDPKDEEGVRLLMLHRANGQAFVYSWDRYGESSDPHNLKNRPSERVVAPTLGALEVGPERMVFAVRGVGLRKFLPSRFHGTLGFERTLFVRLIRDEQAGRTTNPAPTGNASTGDFSSILGLAGVREYGTVPFNDPSRNLISTMTPVKLGDGWGEFDSSARLPSRR